MGTIFTSAVVFQRADGAILTVRKRGTQRFMLIGGKPEPGETARLTALRETREEVGIDLAREGLEFLGMWRTTAANEVGHEVHGTVFRARQELTQLPHPSAEIEQVRWLETVDSEPTDLAPLLFTRVLPALGWESGKWYDHHHPAVFPWDCEHLSEAQYGAPGAMRRQLTDLIVNGTKTATSSRYLDYQGEELPKPGTLERLLDEDGNLLGLVETTAVAVREIGQVDDTFARAEGEGFQTAQQWRQAHEQFWGRGPLPDSELVVTEHIRFFPCPRPGAH